MSDFTYQEGLPLDWADMNENLRLIQEKYLAGANNAAIAIAAANFKGNWSALTGPLAVPASVYHSSKFWLLLANLADVTAATPGVSGSWVEVNAGNVQGPASATDNALARFDGATGKLIQSSVVTLADNGALDGISSLNGGPLSGLRNAVINGNPLVNQRAKSGTVVLAAGEYGHDRWKAGASGCTYTFATSGGVVTLTISSGSIQQVIEGASLQSGTYTLSWAGTCQGKIGAGAFSASGVTGTATGGAHLTIEFNTGTLSLVNFVFGSVTTPFEYRPFGLELTLCRRYYQRVPTFVGFTGFAITATQARFSIPFTTPMRANPSTLDQSGTATDYIVTRNGGGTVTSNTVPTFIGASTQAATVRLDFASGLSAGEGLQSSGNGASYIGLSAEL